MSVGKKVFARLRGNLPWVAVWVLYGACWVLPIIHGKGSQTYIGVQGARFAHEVLWDLLSGDFDGENVFQYVFVAMGWPANELFIAGLVAFMKWPRAAVRCFAFALGIMISWQVLYLAEFPLLIGYWFWVVAGAGAVWLAADRLGRETHRGIKACLVEPATLALFLVPVCNAALDKLWSIIVS